MRESDLTFDIYFDKVICNFQVEDVYYEKFRKIG